MADWGTWQDAPASELLPHSTVWERETVIGCCCPLLEFQCPLACNIVKEVEGSGEKAKLEYCFTRYSSPKPCTTITVPKATTSTRKFRWLSSPSLYRGIPPSAWSGTLNLWKLKKVEPKRCLALKTRDGGVMHISADNTLSFQLDASAVVTIWPTK